MEKAKGRLFSILTLFVIIHTTESLFKQKNMNKALGRGCDLTFSSAGVDPGTQPDQLVSFLGGKVLDPDQCPVLLKQTQTFLLQ